MEIRVRQVRPGEIGLTERLVGEIRSIQIQTFQPDAEEIAVCITGGRESCAVKPIVFPKLIPSTTAPLKFAFVKIAELSTVPTRLALVRFALVRLAPVRVAW